MMVTKVGTRDLYAKVGFGQLERGVVGTIVPRFSTAYQAERRVGIRASITTLIG